jgi:hypothetical protein
MFDNYTERYHLLVWLARKTERRRSIEQPWKQTHDKHHQVLGNPISSMIQPSSIKYTKWSIRVPIHYSCAARVYPHHHRTPNTGFYFEQLVRVHWQLMYQLADVVLFGNLYVTIRRQSSTIDARKYKIQLSATFTRCVWHNLPWW